MTTQAQRLRALIDSGEPFIAADCYSALTGRIVEQVGFKAAYLGGQACGAFHYAVPDNGILSQVEQIEQAARITAVIDIPLIVDADTLGQTVADAFHLVRRYEQAGVAGIHVEDEVNPKHGSFANGLVPIIEMQAKLEACVQARQDPAFVLIARCDELYPLALGGGGGGSVDDAIERGQAYLRAGADAVVFPLANEEATAQLVKAMPERICVLSNPKPGAIFAMSTGWGWSGAAQVHLERSRALFETGSITFDSAFEGRDEMTDKPLYDSLIGDWARKTGRPVR